MIELLTAVEILRDRIAESIWRAEYRRAAGKERVIEWAEVAPADVRKYLYLADAILPLIPASAQGARMTPTQFVDAILSACDASNWDADCNTGDYYRGLHDAYEAVQEIATEHQSAMYDWTKLRGLIAASQDEHLKYRGETTADIERLRASLAEINGLIFAGGAPIGSEAYFKIRQIAAAHDTAALAQVSEGMLASPDVLKTLEDNCWDLRCVDVPTGGGDADIGWNVVEHHMAPPQERVVGIGGSPLEAVQDALAATSSTGDAA